MNLEEKAKKISETFKAVSYILKNDEEVKAEILRVRSENEGLKAVQAERRRAVVNRALARYKEKNNV